MITPIKTKDFIFKYITSWFNLFVTIGIVGLLFSLALLLRLNVFDDSSFTMISIRDYTFNSRKLIALLQYSQF